MQRSIVILGGGPAGCAAALTLRRYLPDLPFTWLAGTPAINPAAVGETLSPGVAPLLHYLGLQQQFLKLEQLHVGGTASAWGSPDLFERTYLFTGQGQGWHLDRARFDAWLLSEAEAAGAQCLRVRARKVQREGSGWLIQCEDGHQRTAAAIIDATGRSAWFARHQAGPPRRDDGLIADARWFIAESAPENQAALVESVSDGWWYSALLPGQRGVAMFLTDSDLRHGRGWADRLTEAPATRARLAAWQATGEAVVRAAHSQLSERAAGEGWVACGDAAAAFDPISALGIGFSLRSGMEAARVSVAAVEGEFEAAAGYQGSLHRIYADYRSRLQRIYRLERRWPESPFWARRAGAAADIPAPPRQ